ncbi:proteolipid protein 2 [Emydura macquarii macquarii]|uniref:proteolipid protein 2 n=1 Tax=Emydura macquarii macquarii TaxID=1129001 RepID=UPI003529EBC4
MESSGGSSPGCAGQCTAFLRTQKGIVLALEIGLCIVILICYGASRSPGYTGVAICELVFSIAFFIVYTLGLNKQLAFVHWGWSDFIRAVIGALLFLITSVIVLIGQRDGPGLAAGVFGLLAGILLAYDAYITLPRLQKNHTAAPTESPEGV